jgi:hypothetical protein
MLAAMSGALSADGRHQCLADQFGGTGFGFGNDEHLRSMGKRSKPGKGAKADARPTNASHDALLDRATARLQR